MESAETKTPKKGRSDFQKWMASNIEAAIPVVVFAPMFMAIKGYLSWSIAVPISVVGALCLACAEKIIQKF